MSFTRTIIIKKEGIKKEIDLVRGYINKLTDSSYEVISKSIITHISKISKEYSEEDCIKFMDFFIDIFSNFADPYCL